MEIASLSQDNFRNGCTQARVHLHSPLTPWWIHPALPTVTPQFGSLLCNFPSSPCSGNQFPTESQGRGLTVSLELFLVL